jgi:hypothetical protein
VIAYTFSQTPGLLNLELVRGDDFSFSVDFNVTLFGYVVSSRIIGIQFGEVVATPTTVITSSATGVVSVSLTSEETAALPAGTYRWQMDWTAPGDVDRRVLAGFVEVRR